MNLNKNFLLPHRCQIAGWLMIAVAIVIAVTFITVSANGTILDVPVILTWIPALLGLMLVCLSREKIDDEYINSLRGRIVCILIVVAFTAKILQMIITTLSVSFGIASGVGTLIALLSLLYKPLVLVIIYIIAFKLTLFIQNRRINRYAEQ